jgi:hypothetical protein
MVGLSVLVVRPIGIWWVVVLLGVWFGAFGYVSFLVRRGLAHQARRHPDTVIPPYGAGRAQRSEDRGRRSEVFVEDSKLITDKKRFHHRGAEVTERRKLYWSKYPLF